MIQNLENIKLTNIHELIIIAYTITGGNRIG